jgi:hypothetical protein
MGTRPHFQECPLLATFVAYIRISPLSLDITKPFNLFVCDRVQGGQLMSQMGVMVPPGIPCHSMEDVKAAVKVCSALLLYFLGRFCATI